MLEIIKIKHIKTYDEVLASHGRGNGCEICKPAVASILASLWNESVVDQTTIQDTNDRFLANIQRGGTYSVVPRVPGGEITPEKLIALGTVAASLASMPRLPVAQRVDMFGAPVHQLPYIWEDLVKAGFESGHAYAKALRAVKSCVGSTWCRFGVQDSVAMAIRVENRYKGLRAAHKLKAAVSGCIRECAEAQCKDFGIIAVDKGWNLYVCGNGGAKPRHADLIAADIDAETCIKYIDRFLMYYTQTADRLTRTSVWLEKLEGGLEYLKDVIINDRLGICDELERQMQHIVDTYHCEWAEVVNDPEKRRLYNQFVNTDETEPSIEFVKEREQQHPGPWTGSFVPAGELTLRGTLKSNLGQDIPGDKGMPSEPDVRWTQVGKTWDFPRDGGATIKYGKTQIAVFNFTSRGEWYATQNMCPHRREFVLSRGMIGDASGVPKVACPVHKKTFALATGKGISDKEFSLQVFPVRVDGDDVYLELPSVEELDAVFATEKICNGSCHVDDVPPPPKNVLPKRKAKVMDPFAVNTFGDPV